MALIFFIIRFIFPQARSAPRFFFRFFDVFFEEEPEENQPKIIFIDEVQDLEKNCFFFFKYFFPNSKIVIAGDVFQSIQKEPRESLLWSLLNNTEDNVEKFYMNITRRVPRNILDSLKKTLTEY